MNNWLAPKTFLAGVLALIVLAGSSMVFAGSDMQKGDHSSPPGGSKPPVISRIVDLGAASTFAVFGGGAGITNEGVLTVVKGDIGTTGAPAMITGFHDSRTVYTETPLNKGKVTRVVYTATAPDGSVPRVTAAAVALAVQKAFDKLSPASLPGGIDVSTLGGSAGELGGRYLAPGVYKSAPGSFTISAGDLTLDGRGNPNATFVFQMASTLTVGGPGAALPRSVLLINGAQAKNVYWQVGSAATINAAGGGTMAGTILAFSGVSFSTAGNTAVTALLGRALSLHASVTMVNSTISIPVFPVRISQLQAVVN